MNSQRSRVLIAVVSVSTIVLVAGLAAGENPTVSGSIEDLLMDLQIIPLDGPAPRSFVLDALDGTRFTLADLAGQPAFLYFWATW